MFRICTFITVASLTGAPCASGQAAPSARITTAVRPAASTIASSSPSHHAAPAVVREELHTGEGDPLTLQVLPAVMMEAGDASVRFRIEPDSRSRSAVVEWWSDDGTGGSHLVSLEGERAAIRHTYLIRQLDAGEYEVSVVLTRDDGSRIRRTRRIVVIGRAATP